MTTSTPATKATATPTEAPPNWPAVDPVKLSDFNKAIADGARSLRAAADSMEQYQLMRMSQADFETIAHEQIEAGHDAFDQVVGLLTPPVTPPELMAFDTYARTTRDPSKPWPPAAA